MTKAYGTGATFTAHEIAADPALYNRVIRIGRTEWECLGYSRTGRRVKFGRLEVGETAADGLRQIVRYVDPDQPVKVI